MDYYLYDNWELCSFGILFFYVESMFIKGVLKVIKIGERELLYIIIMSVFFVSGIYNKDSWG